MSLTRNKFDIRFMLMFLLLFPQSILSQIWSYYSYSDEVLAVVGMVCFLRQYARTRIWRETPMTKLIFSTLFLLVGLGWASSISSGLQKSFYVNMMDCFTLIKLYMIYFLCLRMLQRCHIQTVIHDVYRLTMWYIIIGFIFLIITRAVNLNMGYEVRFGLKTFSFINSNAGDYASMLIISLVIIHVYSYYFKERCQWIKVMTIILIFFTLRAKAIGFLATYFLIVLILNRKSKLSFKYLCFMILPALSAAFFNIRYYFIDNVTPRALLLLNGIATANNYFPLGAGFSTYGSNMAKEHYSALYDLYGFNEKWGMNAEESQFLNDNFWPMIMGQYGWIGVLLYVVIIVMLFKIVNTFIMPRQLKVAGFSLFFLFLYSSVGGPIFLHYIGCAAILVFALVVIANQSVKPYRLCSESAS